MSLRGSKSVERLGTCRKELQALINTLSKLMDIVVVEGHRGEEAQTEAFETGRSQLPFPESLHNRWPSEAVDIAPWRDSEPFIDWSDRESFYFMIGCALGLAHEMGIEIRVGADWDMDMRLHDQSFDDLPHIELVVDDD